jgi:hypothetical protein
MAVSFLGDADVSTRKISDQLGYSKVSMTQDLYVGRRLTNRQTSDVLEGMFDGHEAEQSDVGVSPNWFRKRGRGSRNARLPSHAHP